MADKPKRRWLQFSLRSMFVLTTALCVWLAYSMNWIKQRREFFEELRSLRLVAGVDEVQAPGLLWLFGEKGVRYVKYISDTDHPRSTKARALFPEATDKFEHICETD